MAKILCLQDALDYLRLCDGDEDYTKSVKMLTDEYEGMRERYNALRAGFAVEVENAFDGKLRDKDREIVRLREQVEFYQWREGRVRRALVSHPDDEDDT